MNKLMKEARGAISIFLALVLLPMVMVSSVFVDSSRIKLARSMGASAGDLTLNTALTNYDTELKTIYGLFATAQNMDEMMESLEDYYRQSIEAAGIDEDIASDFAGNIMDALKSETGTDDLMNIQLAGLDVEIPQGAHLGNPAVMKGQIVEFMKYRAPLSLGLGLIDSLSNLKDLNKQMDVVEKKNAFYEEHQTMLGHLEDAWYDIQKYQYKDKSLNFPTGDYISTRKSALEAKKAPLQTAVTNTVRYLYDYDNFKKINSTISVDYKCPYCGVASKKDEQSCTSCKEKWSFETGNQVWTVKWNDGAAKTVTPAYNKDKLATVDDVLNTLNKVQTALNKVTEFEKNTASAHHLFDSTVSDPVAQVYAVCQLYRSSKASSSYLQSVKDLLQNLVNLNSALTFCEDEKALKEATIKEGSTGQWHLDDKATKKLKSIASIQLSHLHLDSSEQHGYFVAFKNIIAKSNEYHTNNSSDVEKYKTEVQTAVQNAQSAANNFYKLINEKSIDLKNAISHLNSALKMLNGTSGNYKSARESWETSAKNLGDDTMGQRDLDELNDLKKIVTIDNLNDLITRLTEAKKSLDNILTEIDNFKICDTSWRNITGTNSYTAMVNLIKNCPGQTFDSRIKGVVAKQNSAYDTIINDIKNTIKTGSIATTWATDKQPNLAPSPTRLYSWLYNNFYDENMTYGSTDNTDKINGGDASLDDATSTIENSKAKGQPDPTNIKGSQKVKADMSTYLKAKNGLPSSRWEGEKEEGSTEDSPIQEGEISSDADSMVSNDNNKSLLKSLMELATNIGRDLRDNLYVSEYIMKMFSYDTIEAEIYDKNNTDSNAEFKGSFYTAETDDAGKTLYTVEQKYAAYAADMKTLTNVPITPELNYLYGEEVEYILYGTAGKTGVYATIYALRFALNTVYAFTDAEINNCTMAAATALFGTPPLTPLIPVAKVAMTIALALAESGWDLYELNQGKAIPLIKNRDTWVMKPSGVACKVKEEALDLAKKGVDKIVGEGYRVLNEALAATSEELDAMIKNETLNAQDLAGSAVDAALGNLENYANQALQRAVELCNQVNQEFMMNETYSTAVSFGGKTADKVKEVTNRLKAWLTEQTGDQPIVAEAKKAAVDYLLANDSALITTLFETIEKQADPTQPTNFLDSELRKIKNRLYLEINNLTTKAGTALSNMKNNLEKELSDALKNGADELKNVLSSKLDECFNQIPVNNASPNGAASGMVSSLLSWRYSDYLRIFVTVGLFANEELMLLRIADVIERNMQHKNNEDVLVTTTVEKKYSRFFGLINYTKEEEVTSIKEDAFTLSRSYTYVKLTSHLQVKPLLMTLPFMAEKTENSLTGTEWYEVTVESMMGY